MIDIDLLQYNADLRITSKEDRSYIYDPIRRKNLIVQPEEMVRQLLITYFIKNHIYPKSRLAVEKNVKIDGRVKRFDILVFGSSGKPFLLVECKSFDHVINDKVIEQVAIYNQKLSAPYLCVTNGKSTYLFEINFEDGRFKEVWEWPK